MTKKSIFLDGNTACFTPRDWANFVEINYMNKETSTDAPLLGSKKDKKEFEQFCI
jgi:hypothetical protein